jgi:hypothetical protein
VSVRHSPNADDARRSPPKRPSDARCETRSKKLNRMRRDVLGRS